MNAVQKKFILGKLIPFILREKGQGFVMNRIIINFNPGFVFEADGVEHTTPVCGAAACVLGSIRLLKKNHEIVYTDAPDILGISPEAAYGLFYNWYSCAERFQWPKGHAKRFAEAKTPLGKAKVAASLLKLVVKTGGKCLDREAKHVVK